MKIVTLIALILIATPTLADIWTDRDAIKGKEIVRMAVGTGGYVDPAAVIGDRNECEINMRMIYVAAASGTRTQRVVHATRNEWTVAGVLCKGVM